MFRRETDSKSVIFINQSHHKTKRLFKFNDCFVEIRTLLTPIGMDGIFTEVILGKRAYFSFVSAREHWYDLNLSHK